MLFLKPDNLELNGETIRAALRRELPAKYQGYSANFSEADPDDNGTQQLQAGHLREH